MGSLPLKEKIRFLVSIETRKSVKFVDSFTEKFLGLFFESLFSKMFTDPKVF